MTVLELLTDLMDITPAEICEHLRVPAQAYIYAETGCCAGIMVDWFVDHEGDLVLREEPYQRPSPPTVQPIAQPPMRIAYFTENGREVAADDPEVVAFWPLEEIRPDNHSL